jgi:hypothetical protein
MKKALALVVFGLLFLMANAQLNNSMLSDEWQIHTADSGKVSFQFSSLNYLRNTEYFNKIELGRTLFGVQIHPRLAYQLNAQTTIQAGVFLRSDFGATPTVNQITPTFSVKLRSKNYRRTFIFGTLEGALAHRLIEPLFDVKAAILRRIENGAQYKYNSHKVGLDTWINWEKFIERGSPYKEQFTAGLNLNVSLFQRVAVDVGNDSVMVNNPVINYKNVKKYYALKPILQFTAHHRGGQIDADTSNMVMQFNGALGLAYNVGKLDDYHFQAEAYGVFYRENTNSGYYPYRRGNGIFANVSFSKKGFTLSPSYWRGKGFIADRGTTIYQSVSLDKPGYTEKMRSLLFVRIFYTQKLAPDMMLNVRFEPIWDLHNKSMDYSYSVYISYRLNKTLSR